MSEAHGLGREALWYGLANIVSGAIGFAAIYLFTRLLTPSEYGAFYLALTWASIMTAVACAWINQTLKRYYPGLEGTEREEFMGRILAANLFTAGGLLLLAVVVACVLPVFHQPAGLPWPVLGLTLGTAAPQYVQWLFTIRRQPTDYALNQFIYSGGRLLFGWLMLRWIAPTGEVLAWSLTLSGGLAAIHGVLALREPYRLSRESFSLSALRSLWAYGWPLTLVNGGGWLINFAGRVILEPLAGKAAVGIYSAGQQLAQNLVQLAVLPIITASDPLAIRVYTRDGAAAASRFLSQLFGLLIMLGSGVSVVLVLLADPLATALLDPRYHAAAGLFGYFAPAMLCWLLVPVLVKSQEIGEQLGQLSWLMLGAGALNIGLNFALIPSLGMAGAALAMLAANAALGATCYWLGRQHLHWPLPWRLLAVSTLGLAATAGVIAIAPAPHGVGQCALAFTAYMLGYLGLCAGSMLLLRGVFHEELAFIRQIASRRVAG